MLIVFLTPLVDREPKKIKFLGDGKYELEIGNKNKTIDFSEIIETFNIFIASKNKLSAIHITL